MRRFGEVLAGLSIIALLSGCGGGYKPTGPSPSAEALIAELQSRAQAGQSFRGESVMDYRVGDDRVKVTVLAMGKRGAHIRFNALNPADETTAADLACDGTNFKFIDYRENCQLTGPCSREAIAQLLRVSMEPDDFLLLALGAVPLLRDPAGTVEWNSKDGTWVLQLASRDRQMQQKLVLDGRGPFRDVLYAEVRNAAGEVEWTLTNKDYSSATAEDGVEFRLPSRTRFEQPPQKADLIVRWRDRTINLELDPAGFDMSIPAGLRDCRDKR